MRVHLRKAEVAGDHSVKKSETVPYYEVFLLLAWKEAMSCASCLGRGKENTGTCEIHGDCERPSTSAVTKQRS